MSLAYVTLENKSGFAIPQKQKIDTLKNAHYSVVSDVSVGGDAPKELLKVYEYGKVRKANRAKWPLYIVKTGHKWYPSESLTEYLLNRIGTHLGLRMSSSRIAYISGQLRFMSRYFLTKNQILVHGAEIYAGYWQVDRSIMDEIERTRLTKKVISVQLTKRALHHLYPDDWEDLFTDYLYMLLYDALIGNNDRHFYNWGVVEDINNRHRPFFAPIYDTARGLFWNRTEDYVDKLTQHPKGTERSFTAYLHKSTPKICWDEQKTINHFDLVKLLYQSEIGLSRKAIEDFFAEDRLAHCIEGVLEEFTGLFSEKRLLLVVECLRRRHKTILAHLCV
ncbi:MAG: HipA domain-containing protein [Bacteroidota bacterium]